MPHAPRFSLLCFALPVFQLACSGGGGVRIDSNTAAAGTAGGGQTANGGGSPTAGSGGAAGSPTTQVDPLAETEPDPNLVPFECQAAVTALGPRRIVRLNALQFGASLKAVCDALDVAVPAGVAAPFDYVNVADRFSTFSRSYGMNDAELQSAWETAAFAADDMAAQLFASKPCLKATTPPADCFSEIATRAAKAAYRRPISAEEAAQIAAVAVDNSSQLGAKEAVATLLHVVLMSPEFLFRSELGDDSNAPGNAVTLSAEEQAAAVSLTLESKAPDQALIDAAKRGAKDLATEVLTRLANLDQVPTVPLMIREYFRYPSAIEIFKDPAILPDEHRVDLVKDTDTLVSKVLKANGHAQFFRTLLTTQDVWVSQDTYEWYAITEETKTHEKQLRVPPAGSRLGILTQPSFLIHYSDMTRTKPVQRGRFMLESMLCSTVPELPIGLVPVLPDLGPNATQRERLAAHSQASCQGCHRFMDPIGLAFEQYDEYGRFRTDQQGKALELAGSVSGTMAGDFTFKSALDLIGQLAESEAAEKCFVRHSFRYWMGRNERTGDGCALVAARDAYHATAGDYAALVAALFSSDSFLNRSLSEEEPKP
jgi:Protein of unknown function (DUF1588)/Protein of unknown function (DUF1595)/Protein of unknown function (DUF1585)/Protein of unknown function (DUF1592)